MRIWDVSPGYLNRQSLLGEHRELHGIVSIIRNNKKGYSKHPETLRWVGYGWALKQRHKLLASEMHIRGYRDKTPVMSRSKPGAWPEIYIDDPASQLNILSQKYKYIEEGRLPLPKNTQQLWAQHKYSVLARDVSSYKRIGKWVATKSGSSAMKEVSLELVTLLREPPCEKQINNALLHMWGYVSKYSNISGENFDQLSDKQLYNQIQQLVNENNVHYLMESTALSEFNAWCL